MTARDAKDKLLERSVERASREPSPRRTVSGIILLVYWILLFLGTHLPSIDVGGDGPYHDKYLHLIAFTVLAVLFSWFDLGLKPLTPKKLIFLLAVLIGYAAFDELTQLKATGRTTDIWDFGANVLGCLLGIGAYSVVASTVRVFIPKQFLAN